MTDTIFRLVSTTLSLWESKEKRKYLDRLIALQDEYREAQLSTDRDNGYIDYLEDQIAKFGDIVAADAKGGK